jgi:ribosome-associated protein
MRQQLDDEGHAYITLAQFLKKIDVAGSGGAAKALARSGAATVNGQPEQRPGRKLRQGDIVRIENKDHTVDVSIPPPAAPTAE